MHPSLPNRSRLASASVRLVGWAPLRIVSGLIATCLVVLGCHGNARQSTQAAPIDSGEAEPERGTEVVVERTAGEFLEATVLERNGDRLRVQTHDGQVALNLTRAGVYSLVNPRLENTVGSFAVCGTAPRRWQGCKVNGVQAGRVSVVTPDDQKQSLVPNRVLKVSSLSQGNVQRAFERATEQRHFSDDLAHAGAPQAPADWKPHAGERVIALRKGEWVTAHVHEFEEDGGIRVRWRSDGEIERLDRKDIIPEPPYHRTIQRGDFALLRPKTESQPWIAVKVRRVAEQFKVQDINDQLYEVGATALVPLGH